MIVFRTFLASFVVALIAYTAVTISNHGWNLFPYFFGDMLAMNWAGQFNFDFTGFLLLSAFWTIWRNSFTGKGVLLGVLAFFGGMMFLATYLLYLSLQPGVDVKQVLTGDRADTSEGT